MSITRLVHVTYSPDKADEASRSWKQKCGPLISRQPGCLSEWLLRCRDVPNEFVSVSEWDSEQSIRLYLKSEAHREVRGHHRKMGGGDATVRLYARV